MKIKVLPVLVYCGKYLNTHHAFSSIAFSIQHVYRATQSDTSSAERSLMKKQLLSLSRGFFIVYPPSQILDESELFYLVRTHGHTQSKTLEPL